MRRLNRTGIRSICVLWVALVCPNMQLRQTGMMTTENHRKFFLTIAYFFVMILNNNKGYVPRKSCFREPVDGVNR